jgi:hypothetical protein
MSSSIQDHRNDAMSNVNAAGETHLAAHSFQPN